MTKEKEEPDFDITDRGFNVKAWHLKVENGDALDALIEIKYKETLIRSFLFPSYIIWNIAAHFSDIVDGELSKDDKERGYRIASWDGISGATVFLPETNDPQG